MRVGSNERGKTTTLARDRASGLIFSFAINAAFVTSGPVEAADNILVSTACQRFRPLRSQKSNLREI